MTPIIARQGGRSFPALAAVFSSNGISCEISRFERATGDDEIAYTADDGEEYRSVIFKLSRGPARAFLWRFVERESTATGDRSAQTQVVVVPRRKLFGMLSCDASNELASAVIEMIEDRESF